MSPRGREIDPAGASVLEIAVSGDAFVDGYEGTTIRVQGDDEDFETIAEERVVGELRIAADGDLDLKVPSGLALRIREVGGDLEVTDLANPLEVRQIGGDLWARSLGGAVAIASVGGDASLEGCRGPVELASVGGDLIARDLPGGLIARQVEGDVHLTSAFASGREYAIRTAGDARVLLVGDAASASVRLDLHSVAAIVVRVPLDDVEREPGALRGRIGEGGATLRVESDGRIVVGAEEGVGEAATEDAERVFDEWSDRVAREAEVAARRAAAEAERQIEEIARRAEEIARQATERAEQALRGWGARTVAEPEATPTPTRPRAQTSVREERQLVVLRMLSEGKITADEAARLLEALGD